MGDQLKLHERIDNDTQRIVKDYRLTGETKALFEQYAALRRQIAVFQASKNPREYDGAASQLMGDAAGLRHAVELAHQGYEQGWHQAHQAVEAQQRRQGLPPQMGLPPGTMPAISNPQNFATGNGYRFNQDVLSKAPHLGAKTHSPLSTPYGNHPFFQNHAFKPQMGGGGYFTPGISNPFTYATPYNAALMNNFAYGRGGFAIPYLPYNPAYVHKAKQSAAARAAKNAVENDESVEPKLPFPTNRGVAKLDVKETAALHKAMVDLDNEISPGAWKSVMRNFNDWQVPAMEPKIFPEPKAEQPPAPKAAAPAAPVPPSSRKPEPPAAGSPFPFTPGAKPVPVRPALDDAPAPARVPPKTASASTPRTERKTEGIIGGIGAAVIGLAIVSRMGSIFGDWKDKALKAVMVVAAGIAGSALGKPIAKALGLGSAAAPENGTASAGESNPGEARDPRTLSSLRISPETARGARAATAGLNSSFTATEADMPTQAQTTAYAQGQAAKRAAQAPGVQA